MINGVPEPEMSDKTQFEKQVLESNFASKALRCMFRHLACELTTAQALVQTPLFLCD